MRWWRQERVDGVKDGEEETWKDGRCKNEQNLWTSKATDSLVSNKSWINLEFGRYCELLGIILRVLYYFIRNNNNNDKGIIIIK